MNPTLKAAEAKYQQVITCRCSTPSELYAALEAREAAYRARRDQELPLPAAVRAYAEGVAR